MHEDEEYEEDNDVDDDDDEDEEEGEEYDDDDDDDGHKHLCIIRFITLPLFHAYLFYYVPSMKSHDHESGWKEP